MEKYSDNIPDPKEIEKEISDFLAKKFGSSVRMITPSVQPDTADEPEGKSRPKKPRRINFDLKPEELIAYLDEYIVKQDYAKAVLATKICTHFNRIRRLQDSSIENADLIGGIKNNVLMIGPTGVGKTYMIRLIANKIGVPFVKGDATKFSETGYVGGDVEDLVRDLVREADDDLELAQYGIIYIDEIDKIASARNLVGMDVSRTGVQRALLKPMEETEVDLKVPHDPISMFQEIERYRKTGDKARRTINTKHILFIMSGAFSELPDIVAKRTVAQGIGFGARTRTEADEAKILSQVRSEDLIHYGFESEFVGRLPVRAIFERLEIDDLCDILKNPNNPVVLGKKLDFAAYDIQIKFDHEALALLAQKAYDENTGARGLVSAMEAALLPYEKRLPSTAIRKLPVTPEVVCEPGRSLDMLLGSTSEKIDTAFAALEKAEIAFLEAYLENNQTLFSTRYGITLFPSRRKLVARYYSKHNQDIGKSIARISHLRESVKKVEDLFYKTHGINVVLEEEALDFIIEGLLHSGVDLDVCLQKILSDFEHGLKLIREKTGRNQFSISRSALMNPEKFIGDLIKSELKNITDH